MCAIEHGTRFQSRYMLLRDAHRGLKRWRYGITVTKPSYWDYKQYHSARSSGVVQIAVKRTIRIELVDSTGPAIRLAVVDEGLNARCELSEGDAGAEGPAEIHYQRIVSIGAFEHLFAVPAAVPNCHC